MPGLEFYFNAFFTLSADRHIGMAEGRIPWTAVDRYAQRYDLTDDEFDVLWDVLTAMDAAYLEWSNKESEKKAMAEKQSKQREGLVSTGGIPAQNRPKRR